jgi:formate-dependent phosphoribosylglycinamide formyltransferase (GAR transformylase)
VPAVAFGVDVLAKAVLARAASPTLRVTTMAAVPSTVLAEFALASTASLALPVTTMDVVSF